MKPKRHPSNKENCLSKPQRHFSTIEHNKSINPLTEQRNKLLKGVELRIISQLKSSKDLIENDNLNNTLKQSERGRVLEKLMAMREPIKFPPIKSSCASMKIMTQPSQNCLRMSGKTIEEQIQRLDSLTRQCSFLHRDWQGIQHDIFTMSLKKMLQQKDTKSMMEFI